MVVRVVERRNPQGKHDSFEISKAALGRDLLKVVCQKWFMAPQTCQLWRLGAEGYELVPRGSSLQTCGVDEGSELIMEEQLPDGEFENTPPPWARPKILGPGFQSMLGGPSARWGGGFGAGFGAAPIMVHDSSNPSPHRGVSGLVNLGNTCFMNSSLQCLFALPPLRALLTNESHWSALVNNSNPLGTQGRIVGAMAKLMTRVWGEGNVTHYVPREVKKVVSDWAPQFEGYRQHDSQEFVAFLLDGLHEDLNNRPPPPKKGTEVDLFSLSGNELAVASWNAHLQRNRSEIVNIFHGQLCSRLTCPKCKNESVAYDAMSVLSVPLPRASTRLVTVCSVASSSAGAGNAQEMDVVVTRVGTMADLKVALRSALSKPANCHFVFGEVYQRVLYKEFPDSAEIAIINPGDNIFAYQVDCDPGAETTVIFQVVFRDAASSAILGMWPLLIAYPSRDAVSLVALRNAAQALLAQNSPQGRFEGVFQLKLTGKTGKTCGAVCGDEACRGCEVTSDDIWKKKVPGADGGKDVAILKARMTLAVDISVEDGAKPWESVAVRKDKEVKEKQVASSSSTLTLEGCIQRFSEPETLGANDTWFCPSCRNHVQAQKQLKIYKLPQVLVIHLKRFAQLSARFREKLEDLVEYPLRGLDLSAYTMADQGCIYDLVAVSNHMGGLGGGHYIAHTLNIETKEWWQYNDEHISKCEESSIVSKSAYILFYLRRAGT